MWLVRLMGLKNLKELPKHYPRTLQTCRGVCSTTLARYSRWRPDCNVYVSTLPKMTTIYDGRHTTLVTPSRLGLWVVQHNVAMSPFVALGCVTCDTGVTVGPTYHYCNLMLLCYSFGLLCAERMLPVSHLNRKRGVTQQPVFNGFKQTPSHVGTTTTISSGGEANIASPVKRLLIFKPQKRGYSGGVSTYISLVHSRKTRQYSFVYNASMPFEVTISWLLQLNPHTRTYKLTQQ